MIKNFNGKKILTTRKMKRHLAALGITLIAVSLIVCIAITSATTPSGQTVNLAGSETQFKLNIAYAFVGQGPSNASYTAANGALMVPVTDYPSAVVFNTTRLPGTQIAACDAEIEVYKVQIAADTGIVENHCYFVGTNYNQAISHSELSSLFDHVRDLGVLSGSMDIRGSFQLNWTQNTSLLSHSVGSIGCYSNYTNNIASGANGLWRAGVPNAISVTVQRIGYITISNGSVSLFEDTSNTNATAIQQLSNYGNGFLYNDLVPATKMPQLDLFHPNS
jgi:hypothetical protein